MANESVDDEAAFQAALEGSADDDGDGETRYALTPLGALALGEGGGSGFGPRAVSEATLGGAVVPRRGRAGERRCRPATLLFG